MTLDPTTESIAHFVGLFEIAGEEVRLRDDYQTFKALQALEEETKTSFDIAGVKINAKFKISDYKIKAKVKVEPTKEAAVQKSAKASEAANPSLTAGAPLVTAKLGDVSSNFGVNIASADNPFPFFLPLPSSVATVTEQLAFLFDNDAVRTGDPSEFKPIAELQANLVSLTALAYSINAITMDGIDAELTPSLEYALAVKSAIDDVSTDSLPSDALVLRGDDVSGKFVNGEAVEELPKFSEVLPAALTPEEDNKESPEELALFSTSAPEKSDEVEAVEEQPKTLESRSAVAATGEEETESTDELAQSSKTSPQTSSTGASEEELPKLSESQTAGPAPEDEDTESGDALALFNKGLPSQSDDGAKFSVDPGHKVVTGTNQSINEVVLTTAWLDAPVMAVDGNVSNVAAISQLNVLVDRDELGDLHDCAKSKAVNAARIEKVSTAPEQLGDTDHKGMPKDWFIERIESDVIAVNTFRQFSFSNDMDTVDFEFSAQATYLGTGENLVFNTGFGYEVGFGYDLIIIGGDLINISVISQMNVLIDSDTVDASGGVPVSVSSHDNLLMNNAELVSNGIDSYEEMDKHFEKAVESFGKGGESLSAAVARSDYFDGFEALRVLYISGDLVKISIAEQVNVLGDQDQVDLALDQFLSETGGQAASVSTGSNTLLNSARFTDHGVDSVVMASGDIYDDALLYQAELIDTDANPSGVNISELASEAVAFLADDLIPEEALGEEVMELPSANEGAPSVDVLQTMIA